MPETRGEKLFFGVVMSITMAVGMEIYNVAISMGYALQPGGLSGMTKVFCFVGTQKGRQHKLSQGKCSFPCAAQAANVGAWDLPCAHKLSAERTTPHGVPAKLQNFVGRGGAAE